MAVHAPAPAAAPPRVSGPPHDLEWPQSTSTNSNAGLVNHPRNASPPRINPYHLIHHPDSDDPLPPLPPHLARLASGEAATDDEGDSDTSDEEDSDCDSDRDNDDDDDRPRHRERLHQQRIVADTRSGAVVILNHQDESTVTTPRPSSPKVFASPPPAPVLAADTNDPTNTPAPRRIMKKVSSVFRRADPATKDAAVAATKTPRMVVGPTPERQRSPMMQGPPPSPPLSDDDDEVGDASSVAVTEVTEVTVEASEEVFHSPADTMQQQQPQKQEQQSPKSPDSARMGTASLMPVTEAGESNPALAPPKFAMSLTSESPDADGSPNSSLHDIPLERPPVPPFAAGLQAPRRVSNGSTSSRAGSLSIVRSGRLAPKREHLGSPDGSREVTEETAISDERRPSVASMVDDRRPSIDTQRAAGMSIETQRSNTLAYIPSNDQPFPINSSLPPPPLIQRRNTNPTIGTQPRFAGGRALTHSASISVHSPSATGQYDNFNLPADILAQTEILRRERLERRQKKMSLLVTSPVEPETVEVVTETSPTRRGTTRRKETDDAKVLVGNLVGEGHRNYVLMYNMLTGIRVAVSRCQAKIKRPLTDEDYTACHKYTFDMLGNELTPSARYDFKFKDYAPWVFRELRDEHFHLDPADYLLSLTAKYILSELGSPGKSGSFFYYSRDYRFIIKTIPHSEHNFLRSILKDYHEHVRANPHTLLSRFYGLHRVKMPRGRKIHFVIMNNLFPPHRDIHETYDLKGSAWGREYPEEKAKNNPRAVLKDKNWVNRGRTLELGPEKRALLTEQLRRDMEFLKRMNVMDYSLLVGIHNMERGNRDNLRENTLAVFHPHTAPVHRKPSAIKSHAEAHNIRRAVGRADPQRLLDAGAKLPQDGSADRRHFLFYQDEGGLRATDEQNNPMDMIYYLGVIDICTPYNTGKRIEHAWKSMTENAVTISCVDPVTYGHRFLDFLMSVMRGGDPALRPQGLESPPKRNMIEAAPVGSELDKDPAARQSMSRPRPVFVEEQVLSSSPVTVPEDGESNETVENGIADVSLPPPVPTVPTEAEAVEQHDQACDDCGEHNRPAIVGHLKTE